jgi:hypothetical protein
MKLAIISDIHDNLVNLEKCLKWCGANQVETLLCCGDVTNDETLEIIANDFTGKIYLVKGNIDFWDDKDVAAFEQINYLGRNSGAVKLDGKKIGLCHEPRLLDRLIEADKPDIIFFGHTHQPWEETQSGVRCVNPGTLGGVFQKATFAAYDTANDDLQLIILETLSD